MTVILGIDPGTEKSGWCLYDGERVIGSGVDANQKLLYGLNDMGADELAIERIQGYGMVVGREVFETCEMVGRLAQAWKGSLPASLIYRRDIKIHLCGVSSAKDANVRQALLDRFERSGGGKTPQVGTKSLPGPLYGVSSHAWSALAVAVVARSLTEGKK